MRSPAPPAGCPTSPAAWRACSRPPTPGRRGGSRSSSPRRTCDARSTASRRSWRRRRARTAGPSPRAGPARTRMGTGRRATEPGTRRASACCAPGAGAAAGTCTASSSSAGSAPSGPAPASPARAARCSSPARRWPCPRPPPPSRRCRSPRPRSTPASRSSRPSSSPRPRRPRRPPPRPSPRPPPEEARRIFPAQGGESGSSAAGAVAAAAAAFGGGRGGRRGGCGPARGEGEAAEGDEITDDRSITSSGSSHLTPDLASRIAHPWPPPDRRRTGAARPARRPCSRLRTRPSPRPRGVRLARHANVGGAATAAIWAPGRRAAPALAEALLRRVAGGRAAPGASCRTSATAAPSRSRRRCCAWRCGGA